MAKRKLKRRYKTYTDPYAKDWYMSIYRPSDWDVGGINDKHDRQQAALVAADYIEGMYRHHQRKYLHNRDSVENSPNFVGPVSPKNYISPNTKEGLQFENFDSRVYGTYNDNYPNMPTDYDKYKKFGGIKINKRKKAWVGTATAIASALGALISGGVSISNAVQNARNAAELRRKENLTNNLNNSMAFTENQLQAANYGQNEELATNRFNELNTLNSAMRCGGKKRMKRAGGTVVSDLHKLGLYI